jgi:hypothetical protein
VTKKTPVFRIVLITALVLTLVVVPSALAAKGGGGGQTGTSSSLSLVMVSDSNANGLPNWGDQVTFNVSTTATTTPYVSLKCYQSGSLVYSAVAGFFPDYPWPWTKDMTLSSTAWAGGAADCTARLYYPSGKRTITLTTLDFHAAA